MTTVATDTKNSQDTLPGKRIAIVEDEGLTQMQLQTILKRAGLVVVGGAANGLAGVDLVLRERPEIVLIDIKMSLMNGLEAAERILASCSVCVIMLTAYSEDAYRRRAAALGVSGFVNKPISSETLLPQLRAALDAYEHGGR